MNGLALEDVEKFIYLGATGGVGGEVEKKTSRLGYEKREDR